MTSTLAQDLGGVVRLLEKATPGEWYVDSTPHNAGFVSYQIKGDENLSLADTLNSEVAMIGNDDEGFGRDHDMAGLADMSAIAAAVNFLRTHSAEIAEALRDAERYRLLRDQASWWLVSTPDAAKLSVMLPRASIDAAIGTDGCAFDAAIDSAMQHGGGGGE